MDDTLAADSATIENAHKITDGIVAAIDSALDWRVYEELTDGRWRLIDVKPTLRAVRWQYDPEMFPDTVEDE